MNKRGFTLTELLAVLVILSIIALITIPIISSTIGDSRESLTTEQIRRLEEAAKTWSISNVIDDVNGTCVTIEDLKSGGYLENVDIKNPSGGSMTGGVKITWDSGNNQYVYKYDENGC